MTKEPTLAECVDRLRDLMHDDRVWSKADRDTALARAIEVCERVRDHGDSTNAKYDEFDKLDAKHIGDPLKAYSVGWSSALAWARRRDD